MKSNKLDSARFFWKVEGKKSVSSEDPSQMLKIIKTATEPTFRVRVQPGTSRNEIVQVREDALKIRISAPPIEGKANRKK